jgi:dGTP triphosphohydrolase
VRTLFEHYCEHPQEIPSPDRDADAPPRAVEGSAASKDDTDTPTRVMDYIAGMTDRFCIRQFQALTVPRAFPSS